MGGPNTHITNPRWRTAYGGPPPCWKNRKIAISRTRFDRFRPNLARRRSSALYSRPTVENLKFEKFKNAAAPMCERLKFLLPPLQNTEAVWIPFQMSTSTQEADVQNLVCINSAITAPCKKKNWFWCNFVYISICFFTQDTGHSFGIF